MAAGEAIFLGISPFAAEPDGQAYRPLGGVRAAPRRFPTSHSLAYSAEQAWGSFAQEPATPPLRWACQRSALSPSPHGGRTRLLGQRCDHFRIDADSAQEANLSH